MSRKSSSTATMGIDIGKNSFHVIGLDERGAIQGAGQRAVPAKPRGGSTSLDRTPTMRWRSEAIAALQRETRTIPIVFANESAGPDDPPAPPPRRLKQ
jgi:hypothetical protein